MLPFGVIFAGILADILLLVIFISLTSASAIMCFATFDLVIVDHAIVCFVLPLCVLII